MQLLARRVAVVGSSALLLAVPVAAPALADPPPSSSGTPDAQVVQLSAAELPDEMVEAITRDLKISPQEYLDRAARAQELDSYATDFRAKHPEEFSGAWMDLDGQPVVAVTTTAAAQTAARDGYRTQMAPVSADGLERSLADFNQWVSQLPSQVASQIGAASIDVLNSQIVVDIANSPLGRAIDLPTQLENIKVQLKAPGPVPVERVPMGGDTYLTFPERRGNSIPDEFGMCSLGFSATDRNGNAINISAGHCDPTPGTGTEVYLPNGPYLADSVQVGKFERSHFGGTQALDYSLIRLNDAGVRAGLDRPVIRGAGGSTLTVTGTAVPVVGAPICKSGQATGFTCGIVAHDQVQAVDEDETPVVEGFASTACTLPGDSGGPIVTGTLALGITSLSNILDEASCAEANLELMFNGGTISVGFPIQNVLNTADNYSGGGFGAGLTVNTGTARD
ncbi:protease [Rhodococcus spongiicola]|uniref:Protease n=1 Tax=Rhodococcus spongiicola TaxID=2487352 RepID=A0A3S3DYE8_9NOCA|nr:protease [Rhodococcus spongiicola]